MRQLFIYDMNEWQITVGEQMIRHFFMRLR